MRQRRVAIALAAVTAACYSPTFDNPYDPAGPVPLSLPILMVDDFDSGEPRNRVGGCPEVFLDPFATASVEVAYDNRVRLRDNGYSLRITYDLRGTGDPFGGYVQTLTGNDLCPAVPPFRPGFNVTLLSFWVNRSDENVDVEFALKDLRDCQTTPKILARTTAPGRGWQRVVTPIPELVGGLREDQSGCTVDLGNLREINFGFGRARFAAEGIALRGSLNIDEVSFQ